MIRDGQGSACHQGQSCHRKRLTSVFRFFQSLRKRDRPESHGTLGRTLCGTSCLAERLFQSTCGLYSGCHDGGGACDDRLCNACGISSPGCLGSAGRCTREDFVSRGGSSSLSGNLGGGAGFLRLL